VKQLRVVDFVMLSGIALGLGALAPSGQVVLSTGQWRAVAALFALTAVGLVIAQCALFMQRFPSPPPSRADR
jgi:hypothetical protein